MYKRFANGSDGTSEDVYNALVERMKEFKEGVFLESQMSSVILNKKKISKMCITLQRITHVLNCF